MNILERKRFKSIHLRNPWGIASAFFFILSFLGITGLLTSDVLHHLDFTAAHQKMAALPLICIGLSYVCLQLSIRRPRYELVKGLLLGIAFVLWGTEQLLPATHLVTIFDETVVTIFVVDLSLIIAEHLASKDHDLP
jgi:hypothetical protein